MKSSKTQKRSTTKYDAEIGRRIRVRRNELGMSQGELGESLGISFQQVQKYEKGVNRVAGGRLHDLAKMLKVPVSYFYEAHSSKMAEETESILFEDPRFSIRLLRAYSKIPQDQQRHLVALMESMANSDEAAAE